MYSISQAAEKNNLTPHTLRYYEKEGLLTGIQRNSKGVREYSDRDMDIICFICCLKETGMTIADIKLFIQTDKVGKDYDAICYRKEILQKHRQKVLEDIKRLNHNLETIDYKIDLYTKKEKELEETLRVK